MYVTSSTVCLVAGGRVCVRARAFINVNTFVHLEVFQHKSRYKIIRKRSQHNTDFEIIYKL